MFEKPIEINVKVDFPALDNLVNYLKTPGTIRYKIEDTPSGKPEVKDAPNVVDIVDASKPVAVKEETEVEEPVEEEKKEAETVEESVPEKHYKPDEVAAMAMKLRDKDKANSVKVKEHFPELGIKSLGDIRSNDEACQKLAKILIDMGGLE